MTPRRSTGPLAAETSTVSVTRRAVARRRAARAVSFSRSAAVPGPESDAPPRPTVSAALAEAQAPRLGGRHEQAPRSVHAAEAVTPARSPRAHGRHGLTSRYGQRRWSTAVGAGRRVGAGAGAGAGVGVGVGVDVVTGPGADPATTRSAAPPVTFPAPSVAVTVAW